MKDKYYRKYSNVLCGNVDCSPIVRKRTGHDMGVKRRSDLDDRKSLCFLVGMSSKCEYVRCVDVCGR